MTPACRVSNNYTVLTVALSYSVASQRLSSECDVM